MLPESFALRALVPHTSEAQAKETQATPVPDISGESVPSFEMAFAEGAEAPVALARPDAAQPAEDAQPDKPATPLSADAEANLTANGEQPAAEPLQDEPLLTMPHDREAREPFLPPRLSPDQHAFAPVKASDAGLMGQASKTVAAPHETPVIQNSFTANEQRNLQGQPLLNGGSSAWHARVGTELEAQAKPTPRNGTEHLTIVQTVGRSLPAHHGGEGADSTLNPTQSGTTRSQILPGTVDALIATSGGEMPARAPLAPMAEGAAIPALVSSTPKPALPDAPGQAPLRSFAGVAPPKPASEAAVTPPQATATAPQAVPTSQPVMQPAAATPELAPTWVLSQDTKVKQQAGDTATILPADPLAAAAAPERALQSSMQAGQLKIAQPNAPLVAVAREALEAISLSTQNQIEIQLHPRELGKLRLAMVPMEGQITVQVSAERPEVLDGLRRHIDVLAEELRNAGFGEASFEFSQGQSGTADAEQDIFDTLEDVSTEALAETAQLRRWQSPNARLDIRL